MKLVLYYIFQIVNYIAVLLWGTTFFLERKHTVRFKNVKILLIFCAMLINFFNDKALVLFVIIQIILMYILLNILFIGKRTEKAVLVIIEIASIATISIMLQSTLQTVFMLLHMHINDDVITIIVGCLIILLLLIANKIYGKRARKVGVKYAIYFMLLVVVEAFITTGMSELIVQELEMARKLVFQVAYIILVIGMFIQIGLMIALIISRNVYREKEYLAAKYLEEQKIHYEYLENRERLTKKFRHDIKNHLIIVNDLMHKQEYEKCKSYMQEIGERVDGFSYKISVNNGIADAIVNKFYMEAKQKGIELQVKGHLPNPCYLSAFDLCTILSNLLSNAVEAEHEAEGSMIHLQLRYTETEIMLAIENDYRQKLNQENGAFFTTKEDKLNHGFGLENVKECVRKNHGHFSINTKNQIFRVLVCLANREGTDEDCYR